MSMHAWSRASGRSAAKRPRPSSASSVARRGLVGIIALLCGLMLVPASALAFSLAAHISVTTVGSTVPTNGDVNPYGIAHVPQSIGSLVRGDVLISNFNDSGNLQGTGTTLVQVSPQGKLSLFAQINPATLPGPCPGGVGLTTALTILPDGFVVVGSLPTENGQAATAQSGCLIVLNPNGQVVRTISGRPINGPWDMTSVSFGPLSILFVTNVLNGTVESGEKPTDGGTVVRLVFWTGGGIPALASEQVIATGFPERTDPSALVVGPTGVGVLPGALGSVLYVADTQGNRIAAVPNPLFRQTPFEGGGITVASGGKLNNPLGLTLTPTGNILTANAGDGNIVETAPSGAELAAVNTGAGAGGLFGLTLTPDLQGVYFVNDTENALNLLH